MTTYRVAAAATRLALVLCAGAGLARGAEAPDHDARGASARRSIIDGLTEHSLFTRMAVDGDVVRLQRGEAEWTAVRSEPGPFVVKHFVLPGGESIDLVLRRFYVTGPTTQFVIGRKGRPDVPLAFDPSSIALFRGSVRGKPGSHVYLAFGERQAVGSVDLGPGGRRFGISSRSLSGRALDRGQVSVFESTGAVTAPSGVPLCGVVGDQVITPDGRINHPFGPEASAPQGSPAPRVGLKHMELAVDTDYEYFFLFGDEVAAEEYLVLLYGAVSDIYMRDVNVRVELVFTRIWTDPDDLYNGGDPLTEFYTHWEANMGAVSRDAAQLFSGRRNYPFGGQGFVSQLCNFAYSVIGYAAGFFPDPTKPSPYNWDVIVTSHELGHNSGTLHTHDYGLDTCNNPNSTPQRGPIMSYCGQTWSGMNANHDNYFHTFVRTKINEHVDASSCIIADCNMNSVDDAVDVVLGMSADLNGNLVPDECEDCNNNGVLDPADIAGSSLDLNSNGIPDECEPDCNNNNVPDDRDIALGASSDAYGNGIPDECETDCNGNGISDYTEIQLNMPLDKDRNAVLDACQDCDADGTPDLQELSGSHFLWIASGLDNSVIREFHPTTGVLTQASIGFGAARVREGQDVVVAPDGRVLVSSALDNRVMAFNEAGAYLGDFVSPGGGGLVYPTGMTFMSSGDLLVSSRDTDRVLRFNGTTGAFVGTFVGPGSGGLVAPFGLTNGHNGNLFVTSAANEVLEYDGASGAFVRAFVDAANNGTLDQPRGLAFKPDGNLLVASYGTDEVLEYEWPGGTPLGKWAQVGTATRITQDSPWGIRVGPDGQVYVSRTGSDFSSGGPLNDHDDIGFSHLTDARMFEYNVCTGLFRKTQIGGNDHGLFFATGFDFVPGWEIDCNFNQLPDDCDLASGFSVDANGNGVPDECDVDCNGNGTYDRLDLIPYGVSFDCNCNFTPDECDIASGASTDCNANGRPDECEPDCNGNGVADGCDLAGGGSFDCNGNGVPDECESDCNGNGLPDDCDLASGNSQDCNGNGVLDECDTASGGVLLDVDFEGGLPSGWTTTGIFQVTGACAVAPVCNGSQWAYAGNTGSCSYGDNQLGELISPTVTLAPAPATLEFCSLVRTETGFDFANVFVNNVEVFSESGETGVWQTKTIDLTPFAGQTVTIKFRLLSDSFVSGTLGWQVDKIKLTSGSADCNGNTVPDECEPDEDCDLNGTRDICDIGAGTHPDCNFNLVPDLCDIASGTSPDTDGNGVPDECESCVVSSAPTAETIADVVNVKNRFLSISAGDPGHQQAIRVRFSALPPPYDVWNGAELWVTDPVEVSQNGATVGPIPGFPTFLAATLSCNGPVYRDWASTGMVHVFHEGIVPLGTYHVQVVDSLCLPACEACYSPELVLSTAKWGDTVENCTTRPCSPAEGVVNIVDAVAVIERFISAPLSIEKPRADLEPRCPDLIINVSDVLFALEGFQGLSYPFAPSATNACDSTCINPLP